MTTASLRAIGGAYTAKMDDDRIETLRVYYSDPSHNLSRRLKGKAEQAGRHAFVNAVRGGNATTTTTKRGPGRPKGNTNKVNPHVNGGSFNLAAVLKGCPKGTVVTLPGGITVTA